MEKRTLTDDQIRFILKHSKTKTYEVVAELYNETFDDNKTANAIRKTYDRYRDYDFDASEMIHNMKDNHNVRAKNSRLIRENKTLLDNVMYHDQFLKDFKEILAKNPIKMHKAQNVKAKKSSKERIVVMHLSDTHFQAAIDREEVGGMNAYGNKEEARRLAFFTREIANFKPSHRAETELVVVLNGDILQGIIHDQESIPAITTQVSCGLHLLSQSFSYLANQFKKVTVICTTGNHERMMHKGNKGRQSRGKWDSFSTIMYVGLKHALAGHKNISFDIPATPYAYRELMGHKYLFVHSDTVLSTGYPGKSINVSALKSKINDLKEGIGHIDVVVCGHVHVDTKQILQNGVTLLTNGCMSGLDEFALSIGITKNNPTQQMWEVTKEHAVGDMRSVYLIKADTEEALDKIVEPFKGKF